jgi:hypothetical protein
MEMNFILLQQYLLAGQEEGTVMSGDTIQNVVFGSYTPDQVEIIPLNIL